MTNSRRKGRESERQLERIIEAKGIDTDRSLGGRAQPHGDVSIPGVAIECRRRERIDICKWCNEHGEKVPSHLTPVVAFRKSGEPWRVALDLDDFLDLYLQATS